MLKLITGLPGSFKTANSLDDFLNNEAYKFRPKFCTHIEGLDYEKHDITKIDDLTQWATFPDGSVVLVDEAQQFLRPRKKEASLPEWVSAFETHRHRGMDFIATTQHPMLLDVHFRRLVGEHIDLKRVSGFKRVAHRLFQRCMDDPNDFHALKEAQTSIKKVNPRVFSEYTSTQLDTHKFKIPTKLLYWGTFIALLFGFALYMGYPIFSRWFGVASSAKSSTVATHTTTITPPQTVQAPAIGSSNIQSQDHPLTAADFEPVTPLAPWSAPIYRNIAQIVAAPHFAGCLASPKKCNCYTQQGTSLDVDTKTCLAVIHDNAMPFNPFKKDSDTVPYNPDSDLAQNQPQEYKHPVIVGLSSQPDLTARNQQRDDAWNNASPSLQNSQTSSKPRNP